MSFCLTPNRMVLNEPSPEFSRKLLVSLQKRRKLSEENHFGDIVFSDELCKSFIKKDENHILLGKGSFGQVSLVKIQNIQVAVKICPSGACVCFGEKNLERIQHSNVAQVHKTIDIEPAQLNEEMISFVMQIGLPTAHFLKHGMQVVVMEYAGGRSLQQLLEDPNQNFSLNRKYKIISQIACALWYCHQRDVIHLDVKPANVMVMVDDACKLVDFGSSKRQNLDHKCLCQDKTYYNPSHIGTIFYSAPETFLGTKITPKVDIYSLGITMWQVWTGLTPFERQEAQSVVYRVISAKLRPSLEAIKKKDRDLNYIKLMIECWNQDHSKRPTSKTVWQKLSKSMQSDSN